MKKELGFGFMRLPLTDPTDQKAIDYDLLIKMVDYFMENGFNVFDAAIVYHEGICEQALKKTVVDRWFFLNFGYAV
ncbi:MAG: aldo/keto reductase [Lachnospiraceae bacterium]|nr:aldo/keto reductase [Lachnospiraceae bacterium]